MPKGRGTGRGRGTGKSKSKSPKQKGSKQERRPKKRSAISEFAVTSTPKRGRIASPINYREEQESEEEEEQLQEEAYIPESDVGQQDESVAELDSSASGDVGNESGEDFELSQLEVSQQQLALKESIIEKLKKELADARKANEYKEKQLQEARKITSRVSQSAMDTVWSVFNIENMLHGVIDYQVRNIMPKTTAMDQYYYVTDEGKTLGASGAEVLREDVTDIVTKEDGTKVREKVIINIDGEETVKTQPKHATVWKAFKLDKPKTAVKEDLTTRLLLTEGKDFKFVENATAKQVPIYYKTVHDKKFGATSFLRMRMEMMGTVLAYLIKHKRQVKPSVKDTNLSHLLLVEFNRIFGFHFHQLEYYYIKTIGKKITGKGLIEDATEEEIEAAKEDFKAYAFDITSITIKKTTRSKKNTDGDQTDVEHTEPEHTEFEE